MASSRHHNDSDTGGYRKRMKLELASSYHIIWLDTHICEEGEFYHLKTNLVANLIGTAAVPPLFGDPKTDGIVYHNREHDTPITFVDDTDQALKALEKRSKLSKVFFFTPGRLGREVIPRIHEEELTVYRYYIFCGTKINHVDWVMGYVEQGIQMLAFDFDRDLLIRLARDMCREFIEEGRKLFNCGNTGLASKHFEYALSLGDRAYSLDLLGDTERRRRLCGEDSLNAKTQRAAASLVFR